MARPVLPCLFAVLLVGCAGMRSSGASHAVAAAPRVAVLPMAAVVAGIDCPPLEVGLSRGLADVQGLGIVPAAETARVLGSEPADCAESLECLRRVGAALHATHVASPTAVGLGETVLVRVRLVEVFGAHDDRSRQELVRAATAERVEAFLERTGRELGRSLVPRKRAGAGFYTAVAIVGAGLVTATAVTIANRGPTPDAIVRPP
ncbi:MAG: hypothetical protein U0230_20950 [Polyangiales bacterium]